MALSVRRPFRFGVVSGASDAVSWLALARTAEELGYSVLLNSDHLDMSGAHTSTFAPIPALGAASAVTSVIKLGTSVLNHDWRHPAILAREVASLDVLSEGRFELGLGAGWAEYEYNWAGIEFKSASERIARLAEYVAVLKSLLECEMTSFQGDYFVISEMPGIPRPVQSPRPKLMLGGTFERMLSLAAREAEIVSVMHTHPRAATAAAMDQRLAWIRGVAGARFAEIEINTIIGNIVVADGDRSKLVENYVRTAPVQLTAGLNERDFLDAPISLIGSVESICDELERWRERWNISYVIVESRKIHEFAPIVERLVGR